VFKNYDSFYYSEEVVVRVLVVGSCGKRKLHNSPKQPKCQDIRARHGIGYWRKRFSKLSTPARDVYTGPQNTELVKAVDLLRTISRVDVHLAIISAGFGILQEHERVPPYDCSFTNMTMRDVRKRSEELELQSSFTDLISKNFDLVYLALGKRYLAALGKDTLSTIQTPTVVFHEQESEYLIRIPCSAQTVNAFSKRGHKIHGIVGFKGDLLRVLARFALEKPNPRNEIRKWGTANYLRKLVNWLGGLEKSNG
jgi:hypothetical protein